MSFKEEFSHIEVASEKSRNNIILEDLIKNAREATEEEHNLSARTALKESWPAVLWSFVMSSTIIMEGYDTNLMPSFFAYHTFQQKYGIEIAPGEYELEGSWQSALGCAASIGIIISLCFNGILVERYGHRKIILVNLIILAAFIFITVFARDVEMLFAGQVCVGFQYGFFSILGLIYASEIAPLPLRGFLSAYVMMCWATGQLISSGLLRGLLYNTTEWSFRIPFALQWAWIPPIFVATVMCPDSPYWLVRRGEIEKAERMLKRLYVKEAHFKVKPRLNLMIYTNALEMDNKEHLKDNYKGWKAFIECFKGTNLRRTEIACIGMASQVFAGNNFAYSPSYFFSQVGLDNTQVYNLNLAIIALAWVGTFLSWFLAARFGRRPIFLCGLSVMAACLLVIGALQTPADNNQNRQGAMWGQVACTFVWCTAFVFSLAPLAYTVLAEVSSTRLRSQTIAIGRNAYNLAQLTAQVVQPYLINPTRLGLRGRTGYVWFVTCFLTLIWTYFRLPETKDRTYEELDILFERRIPARKFASYKLDLDAEEFEERSLDKV